VRLFNAVLGWNIKAFLIKKKEKRTEKRQRFIFIDLRDYKKGRKKTLKFTF